MSRPNIRGIKGRHNGAGKRMYGNGESDNSGGTRSMHFHPYPNGPYGPSGHAVTRQRPMGWGFTTEHGNEEVVQPFAKSVQRHWGRYRGGYSHAPSPGGPHTGYMHSSTTHNHDDDYYPPTPFDPPNLRGGSGGPGGDSVQWRRLHRRKKIRQKGRRGR
jgi:hypothetical protein